jgi:lipoyl(octanoyl) transferase
MQAAALPQQAGGWGEALSGTWLLFDSGEGEAAFNMAFDEALLELAPAMNRPVLRFYGWSQPAASFGYFQKISEIERATHLRPLVRRPTGGGLVPHAADWTYSVVVPPAHAWYGLRASESYERMHRWIRNAFAKLGIATELAACCRKEIAGQCFAGYEKADVLWLGHKIAGAAQRRTKTGLLIQGSLQPQPGGISRAHWQETMQRVAENAVPVEAPWEQAVPPERLLHRAAELASEKYSRDDYNRRR